MEGCWEERVRRVVQASHAEKEDGVVRSGLVILMLCKVALIGRFCTVFQIRFVELDEPIDKRLRILLVRRAQCYFDQCLSRG